MAYLNIETSASLFSEIRKNGKYYVDKTGLLVELLQHGLSGKKLFTRPRRFGKSVTLSMIGDFLDITKDSRELFSDLRIMKEPDLVENYLNAYPVVRLSFKDIYGNTIEQVKKLFLSLFSNVTIPHYISVVASSDVDSAYKAAFKAIHDSTFDLDLITESLIKISGCLYQFYHKNVVILIDEYDVPLSKAYGTNHYEAVRDLIEGILSGVCKENEMVQAVILTGCLYSIKGSTHTGVNNIKPFTIRSKKFSSYIGFTEPEVEKLLSDAGMSDELPLVREWYDGYLFGNTHIYCPWDVLNFVSDMQDGEYDVAESEHNNTPKNYWVNTSGTMIDFMRGFLDKVPDAMNQFDRLFSGEAIRQPVNENLPYHELQASGENMWSALLEDGYLTMAGKEADLLRIPNKEIGNVLLQEIGNYFRAFSKSSDMADFWLALWNGEAKAAERLLSDKLEQAFKNLSAGLEYPYQYFLLGAAINEGYQAEVETDAGYGRLDLKVEQPSQNQALLIETKHVKAEKDMEDKLTGAKDQILSNKYYRNLKARKVGHIRCYAVAFYKRECRVEELIIP